MSHENRIPTLDGWRAIAIALVLIDHGGDEIIPAILSWLPGLYALDPLAQGGLKESFGMFGVHLFFCLSGYLITRRLIDEDHLSGVNLKNFYIRRFWRIQPPAMFFLLMVALLGSLGIYPVNSTAWLAAFFGVANLAVSEQTWYTGHFWSLAVEEHFYLIWPGIFVLLAPRHRLMGTLVIACLASGWRLVALKYQLTTGWNFAGRSDIQSEWLLWGCAAALAEKSPRWDRYLSGLSARFAWLVPVALLLSTHIVFAGNWKMANVLSTATAMSLPLLIMSSVKCSGSVFGRLLEARAVVWLGRLSFSLYLWQQLFFAWDEAKIQPITLAQSMPLNLVLALGCAWISYNFVERPAIKFGKRYVSRP